MSDRRYRKSDWARSIANEVLTTPIRDAPGQSACLDNPGRPDHAGSNNECHLPYLDWLWSADLKETLWAVVEAE
jgi:hypothetical protein